MQKRAPTFGRVAISVGFALSCFGLLLFLWTAFGGPIPLAAEGYRIKVPFNEAAQLAVESDVRISGVSVGKVKKIDLSDNGLADATLQIDSRYAPLPADTKAILRQKTLLGETYVELTPGSESVPKLAEGASLPLAQVSDAVQLDEIFRTFDARTRVSFQNWMRDASVALRGRGADLSAALGELEPFTAEGNRFLGVLDTQRLAVRRLIRNTGVVFGALSHRRGQLRSLIQNANTVFATTARRNADLQQTFVVLPTFLDETRATLTRVDRFAATTDPLVRQLRPAARELSPTLSAVGRLAPQLHGFFVALRPVIAASADGLPALRKVLDHDLPPLLGALPPFLRNLTPILEAVRNYKHEITAFLGNAAAATNAFNAPSETNGKPVHYLRTTSPLNPEVLAAYPNRLKINRPNPYLKPLGTQKLPTGLESFETRQCTGGLTASLNPADAGSFPGDLWARIKLYSMNDHLSTADVETPACKQQAPYAPIGQSGPSTYYLHVLEQP